MDDKRLLKVSLIVLAIGILITAFFLGYNYFLKDKQQQEIIQRGKYGISLNVFSQLPLAPQDFKWIDEQMELGAIDEAHFNNITKDYWMQPEFYPNFEKVGLQFYQSPLSDRRNCFGYGSYPQVFGKAVKQEDLKVGAELYAKTWFHTGFGIECYQGTKLNVVVDDREKEYFDVVIDPYQFVLMPTNPQFDKDWTREIRYIVIVKKTPVPKGRYEFSFLATAPDKQKENEWKWQYREKYVNSGMFVSSAKTFDYILIVE
jgi:hypothetical protein